MTEPAALPFPATRKPARTIAEEIDSTLRRSPSALTCADLARRLERPEHSIGPTLAEMIAHGKAHRVKVRLAGDARPLYRYSATAAEKLDEKLRPAEAVAIRRRPRVAVDVVRTRDGDGELRMFLGGWRWVAPFGSVEAGWPIGQGATDAERFRADVSEILDVAIELPEDPETLRRQERIAALRAELAELEK